MVGHTPRCGRCTPPASTDRRDRFTEISQQSGCKLNKAMNDSDVPGAGSVTSPPLHHKESPFFAADRAAYWRHLRELGPVVKIDTGDPTLHGYYLTRRDDVRAALLDPQTFTSPPKTFAINLFGAPLPQVPLSCGTRSGSCPFRPRLTSALQPQSVGPLRSGACAPGPRN